MSVSTLHALRSAIVAAGRVTTILAVMGCTGESGEQNASLSPGRSESALILNLYEGADDVWTPSERVDITYCVSTRFGEHHARAVQEMSEAARGWEDAAYVQFIYQSEYDSDCAYPDAPVMFTVELIFLGTGEAGAESFPPSYVHSGQFHWLGIALPAYDSLDRSLDLRTSLGAFTHELGHILGFRHEHIRPEATQPPFSYDCFDEPVSEGNDAWRAIPEVAQYDPNSAMHYGTGRCGPLKDFALTDTDRAAAHVVYPSPARCEVWAGPIQLAVTDIPPPTSAGDGESRCEAFAINDQQRDGLTYARVERQPDHFRAILLESYPSIDASPDAGTRP
jgi:hypothetical protein